jgi:hypothetical protein
VFLLVQAKQSSEAPLAGALLRRFRWSTVGGSDEPQEEGGQASGSVIVTGGVVSDEIAVGEF